MLEVCGIFLGVWVGILIWFVSPANVGKGEVSSSMRRFS